MAITTNTTTYQIEEFRKYYVDNERPVQELHDRKIEVKYAVFMSS